MHIPTRDLGRGGRPAGLLVSVGLAIMIAACGGGSGRSSSGIPTLDNAQIPTVPAAIPTAPTCDTTANIPLPANFPSDIPVPPGYKVWSVSTSPYLHVDGRLVPVNNGHNEPPKGMVSDPIEFALKQA